MPTLSLALFEGKLKISSSHGALSFISVIFITLKCYSNFSSLGKRSAGDLSITNSHTRRTLRSVISFVKFIRPIFAYN